MPDAALPQPREGLVGNVQTLAPTTRCILSFGAYTDALNAPAYVGLRGRLRPSDKVTELATGNVILVHEWVDFTIGSDGSATLSLPHTDQDGITPQNFTYEVVWDRRLGDPSPGDKVFALPIAGGDAVDFDLLSASANLPGVDVPVIDPTVNPRLNAIETSLATKASTGAMNGVDAALKARLVVLEALAPVVVGPTNPQLTKPGLWVQTGLGNGSDMTFWIEDGL